MQIKSISKNNYFIADISSFRRGFGIKSLNLLSASK
jgi:hypothetical protein